MDKLSALSRAVAVYFAAAALAAPCAVAQEQESRAATIAAAQAEKAKKLTPYVPNKAEEFILRLQRNFVQQPAGWYPYFASVYSGGGFTLGAGYRHFVGDQTQLNVKGLYSIKSYKFFEFSLDSPGAAQRRLDLHARVGWRDATQVAYHGLGIDSPEDRTNFRMKQGYFGANAVFRPVPIVVLGGGLTLEDFTLEEGKGTQPSIEEVFTPATAPGLGASPTYLHLTGSAGIDTRPSPGYARRGGLYAISYHDYSDRDSVYSFDRVDGEIVQHIPLLRENWVISLHGLVQSTLDDEDVVPYFLLPSLGSGSTLRGYPSWRFRDRHSYLMSGEFRWIPNRLALDMAIFYDTGAVADRFSGLSFNNRKSDVGVGARFHGPLTTPLRIELAKGSEGMRLVFAGSAAF